MAKGASSDCATREERERGERFLAAFHSIERSLRRLNGAPEAKDSFRRLVDEMAKDNAVVRRFRDDLGEFGELRNAIVHERISPDYLIAVPLSETVERIEEIERAISDPPAVYPTFKRDVVTFFADDLMRDVFRSMRLTGFTQFPVYGGGLYRGLLTDGAVASWVARFVLDGDSACSMSDVRVDDVLSGEKNPQRARFVSKDTTVYEVEEMFRDSSKREKRRVSAVLITDNGSSQGRLLGIITPSDILSFSG